MKPKEKAGTGSTIDRNIAEVHRVRTLADDRRSVDEKFIDHIAHFLGTTRSFYTHLFFYGSFLMVHFYVNSDQNHWPWVSLQSISLIGTLEAIFLAIFVLINQRRTSALDRKNSDLHLQTSLLVEHELTRVGQILTILSKSLNVDISSVKDLDQLTREVRPSSVMERISSHQKEHPTDSTHSISDEKKE